MSEETNKLINLNVLRAETTLDDAKFLVENQKYHIAVNRIYYSAFYIISAFAIKDGFESSKHQQLIGWFNKNYVANEKVNKNNAKIIMRLFELRNKADYDIYATFNKEQTEELYNMSEKFLKEMKEYLIKQTH